MYFTDAVRVLLRRWYVIVTGLMIMGGTATAVMMYVPTNYVASGSVLFLLPPKDAGDKPINPYINVPQGLTMSSSIVGGVVSTPEAQRDVFKSGFTSDYSVSQIPGSGIPLLYVNAQDTNPQMAVSTVKEVIRRIDVELARMQDEAGAPASQRMRSQSFSVTDQGEAVRGAKIRALAVVGAVGVVLTTVAAFVVDRSQRRTAERRSAAVDATDGGPESGLVRENAPKTGGEGDVDETTSGRRQRGMTYFAARRRQHPEGSATEHGDRNRNGLAPVAPSGSGTRRP